MVDTATVQPIPAFVQSLESCLTYWQSFMREMDETQIGQLEKERQNLARALKIGLAVPATWKLAAEVTLQAIPLINRRMYWREWIPVLEQVAAQCPDGNILLKFNLFIELGRLYRLNRQLGEATDIHLKAEVVARQINQSSALARAYYNISRDYLEMRQYDEAERYGRLALTELARVEGADRKYEAETLKVLGIVVRSRGELEQAEAFMVRAVEIWRSAGEPTPLARALSDLAKTMTEAGKYEQAIATYQEAERILASTANELDKTMVHMNLAVVYFALEDWRSAETALREADSLYLRRSGNLYFQGTIATNLGNVLLKQGRWAEAEECLQQAVTLWGQLEDDLSLANAVGSLGEVLSAQQKYAAAIPHFEKALGLLAQFPAHVMAKQLREMFETERRKAEAGLQA